MAVADCSQSSQNASAQAPGYYTPPPSPAPTGRRHSKSSDFKDHIPHQLFSISSSFPARQGDTPQGYRMSPLLWTTAWHAGGAGGGTDQTRMPRQRISWKCGVPGVLVPVAEDSCLPSFSLSTAPWPTANSGVQSWLTPPFCPLSLGSPAVVKALPSLSCSHAKPQHTHFLPDGQSWVMTPEQQVSLAGPALPAVL